MPNSRSVNLHSMATRFSRPLSNTSILVGLGSPSIRTSCSNSSVVPRWSSKKAGRPHSADTFCSRSRRSKARIRPEHALGQGLRALQAAKPPMLLSRDGGTDVIRCCPVRRNQDTLQGESVCENRRTPLPLAAVEFVPVMPIGPGPQRPEHRLLIIGITRHIIYRSGRCGARLSKARPNGIERGCASELRRFAVRSVSDIGINVVKRHALDSNAEPLFDIPSESGKLRLPVSGGSAG